MNFRLLIVFIVAGILISSRAVSQSAKDQNDEVDVAMKRTVAVYFDQSGDQSALNNGSLYIPYPYHFKSGSPFSPSEEFEIGSVTYDSLRFDSVALLYDNLRQFLILRKDGYLLQLVSERISGFAISGHRFVRIISDSSNRGLPNTGFYELLYPGPSRVLKLTRQDIQEETSATEGVARYIESADNYYIKKGNRYTHIKSKRELLDIFRDRETEIRHLIKSEKLSYGNDREKTMIRLAGFYDMTVK